MARFATLKKWTPKAAASFCRRRLHRTDNIIQEVAYCYGDVDQGIVETCDELRICIEDLKKQIDATEQEGRTI